MSRFHWLLAFDGACCTCRKVSQVVGEACAGRLEIAPLQRADVQGWREQVLGRDARPAPTLLRVALDGRYAPRVWTGPAMVSRLALHLGPRAAVRVLHALGTATRPVDPDLPVVEPGQGAAPAGGPGTRARGPLLGRKDFLKIAAGGGVATSILAAGRAPAAFATTADQQVEAWIAKHAHELPTTYGDVVALPPAYRSAVHARTPVAVRRRWWAEQVARYRAHFHPSLTPAQRRALDRAQAYLRRPDALDRSTGRDELDAVGADVRSAFGRATAALVVATLRAPDDTSRAAAPRARPICNCAKASDYCSDTCIDAFANPCLVDPQDCGTFLAYDCDGLCGTP